MWQEIHGGQVRDDSAEADLFKKLIQDLGLGHVISQHKEKDSMGRILLKRSRARKSIYAKSAFDDKDEYFLTGLGDWFVHYAINDIVTKIGHQEQASDTASQ